MNDATDLTLDAWKAWLEYKIESDPILAGMPIKLRDSEETKTYPGIYIGEGSVDRIEAGGVRDGNSWEIEILTELRTTPGEDAQLATSRKTHDKLRKALTVHVNDCSAQNYLTAYPGIVCHQIRSSSPVTEEDDYRSTRWTNPAVVVVE